MKDTSKVISALKDDDGEGDSVGVAKRQDKKHSQMWKIIYIDKAEKTRTKGMGDYGFHINRPFYIVSRMLMKKVVTTNSSYLRMQDMVPSRLN